MHEELTQPVLAIWKDQSMCPLLRSLESPGNRSEDRCHGARERSKWLGRLWLVQCFAIQK